MEINQIISFNAKDYTIEQVFYRTIGSHGQKLTTAKIVTTEHRRTFYLVNLKDESFWVKEYTESDYGHSIVYEFEETSRLHKATTIGENDVRTVKMICLHRNRLLMEYCDGYTKLNDVQLTKDQRILVLRLIRKWIDEHDIHDYDLCGNNILIKIEGGISLKMIDFEYSIGVNKRKWFNFLKKIEDA